MSEYKFEKGYSQYGAQMGRREYNKPPQKKIVSLFEVRLDSGGYDNGGAYWGIGERLWCAMADEDSTGEEQYRAFTRAHNRKAAAFMLNLKNEQLKKKAF